MWFLSEVTKQPSRKDPNTMADELRIGLKELLRKAQMEHDADFLKEGLRGSRRRSWRSRSTWAPLATSVPTAQPLLR